MKAAVIGTLIAFVPILLIDNQVPSTKNDWYKQLPTCPCTNPDKNKINLNDGWAKDEGNLSVYHHGAAECFRSYPYSKTAAGNSCQQCCYDNDGQLITKGRGAGTPDKISTCAGEDNQGVMKLRYFSILSHYLRDVRPWKQAGSPDSAWKIYNQSWVPNQGDCDTSKTRN